METLGLFLQQLALLALTNATMSFHTSPQMEWLLLSPLLFGIRNKVSKLIDLKKGKRHNNSKGGVQIL